MALVNRPPQSFGLYYGAPKNNIEDYSVPGGLVICGRDNYDDAEFHAVSEGGGCVLIYLDPIINGGYGRYHNYLLGHDEDGDTDPEWGDEVPLWPGGPGPGGAWPCNEYGYLNDFRVGSILQDKLEAVLEMMVAENPHMGGWFMDDTGTRSWFPYLKWAPIAGTGPTEFPVEDKEAYREGAIAICETVRRVCDKYGLVFIVNGTWGAHNTADPLVYAGGGYPDTTQFGCSLADGGFVEHHPAGNVSFFTAYASPSAQWANESAYTNGVEFMLYVADDAGGDATRDLYADSGSFAYVVTQDTYNYPPPPFEPLHFTGLPSRVRAFGYTEVEWNLRVQAPAETGDIYEFRVEAGDVRLDNYLVLPALTIGPTVGYWDEPVKITATVTVTCVDTSTAVDPAAIITCAVTGPGLRRVVTGPSNEPVTAVTGPSNQPVATVTGPDQSHDATGPVLLTRAVTGPGIVTISATGPDLGRTVTGPGMENLLVVSGPGVGTAEPGTVDSPTAVLTGIATGPGLGRTVTGPATETIGVTGPSNQPQATVTGPGTTARNLTGPAHLTRVATGPDVESLHVTGPELSVDVMGPAMEDELVLTGPGVCNGN